ncbi:hypothetical protein [Natronocalculus amylovorans]|uniref:Uncharacterized protein n=1 Tax=Natronocalculus amylovorans TaxID=2917812 RepID=A0AAE3KDI9_9EURY|nr:hypothetical protein [Natronocalculus amylovorans]MCL9818339.1 hypothetical protein [Natronocalculus amylovorans]
MFGDPIREIHDAKRFCNSEIETFKEYHYMREDAMRKSHDSIPGFDHGIVNVHIGCEKFLKTAEDDHIEIPSFVENRSKIPILRRGKKWSLNTIARYCATGFIAKEQESQTGNLAYTRVDRHGILESLSTRLSAKSRKNESINFATSRFEQGLIALIKWYIDNIEQTKDSKVLVILTCRNFSGNKLMTGDHFDQPTVEGDLIRTPVVEI